MSDNAGALEQAQAKVEELLEAAKSGAIIPVRLPGQVEEIVTLLQQASDEHQQALADAQAAAMPDDMGDYLEQEEYFVRHAVHELRTPMTSIRGYSDMLGQMGELNDMQKQFLNTIKTNTRRMEGLLSDVSYINKIRKGTLKIQPKMDMYKNLIQKVEKTLRPRAEELNRELDIPEAPQGLPLLNIDTDLLTVALTKLAENGLQYAPEGDGKVTITGAAEDHKLVITISDNGIGMTEDEQAQLGEIYFRGERDEVTAYKGSGLGIPIAFGMLDLINADYSYESTVDTGTTFVIKIEGMS
jgi:signal transduction histidine kinase